MLFQNFCEITLGIFLSEFINSASNRLNDFFE